jgi:hypothetical protein
VTAVIHVATFVIRVSVHFAGPAECSERASTAVDQGLEKPVRTGAVAAPPRGPNSIGNRSIVRDLIVRIQQNRPFLKYYLEIVAYDPNSNRSRWTPEEWTL